MKTAFKQLPVEFKPVEFTLTCESHEELLMLMDILYAGSTGKPCKTSTSLLATTLYNDLKRNIVAARE